MENNNTVWIPVSGLVLITIITFVYIYFFGTNFSLEHTSWAEFGSFFGGVLSPLIALLAIIMLYKTLTSQILEFKESVTYLARTAKIAADDLELTRQQTQDNETLSVLANAEVQISFLLDCVISEERTQPRLKIFHMCIESARLDNPLSWSDSYVEFVNTAQQEGSVVWSYVYSLTEVTESMVKILQDYSSNHSGKFSPTILYYHGRLLPIIKLLNDCQFITDERRKQIIQIVDMHK